MSYKSAMPQQKYSTTFTSLIFLILFTRPCFATITAPSQDEPLGIFLTWQQDPTTTMTIDYHVGPNQLADSILQYRIADLEQKWTSVSTQQLPYPFSDRIIQRIELQHLSPGTTYQFKMGRFNRIYHFRTMPLSNHRPIRFAVGGDTSTEERFQKMNQTAMGYDLDFIIWGGDLAYANAQKDNLPAWYRWFDGIKKDLISKDGRVIPIVLTIGNHDVVNHHYPYSESTMIKKGMWFDFIRQVKEGQFPESTVEWRNTNAPFYYGLFAFPGHPGYGVLDFGNYLTLLSLDSSHSNLISGKQRDWLESVLKERAGKVAHIVPYYHKQAYPSTRVQPGGVRNQFWSRQILSDWVPLFEKYGVKYTFEHDDHTYKRTYPLLENKINPAGIVYMGDGAWGVEPKTPKTPAEVWYLQKSAGQNHAIIVTLQGPFQHFLVVNNEGEIIDEYPQVISR